jgi:hypothetical protein
MSDRHGPNSWDAYLAVHDRRLADFAHFIVDNNLTFIRTPKVVQWEGTLICADGMEIHVRKTQAVSLRESRPWVQTTDYSYQVLRRQGEDVVRLFRYDNAAHHDHPDRHHKHRYDANGREIDPPVHVGHDGWPTLGDVIDEAFDVWARTKT